MASINCLRKEEEEDPLAWLGMNILVTTTVDVTSVAVEPSEQPEISEMDRLLRNGGGEYRVCVNDIDVTARPFEPPPPVAQKKSLKDVVDDIIIMFRFVEILKEMVYEKKRGQGDSDGEELAVIDPGHPPGPNIATPLGNYNVPEPETTPGDVLRNVGQSLSRSLSTVKIGGKK